MTQKIAIVGYGVEGRSAYRYFAAQGADITVFHKDRPADLPEDVKVVIDEHATDLRGYDVIMRSPPVRPDSLQTDGRVSSVTKEFLQVFGPARVIGVTGSKGKGTTTSLIYEMLKAAGLRVHLAGNIGVPALDLLPDLKDGDYVALELSSFQLWDLDVSPHIAVLLMMEPEHFDVHTSIDEYIGAKANIASHQNVDDITIYLPSNELTMRAVDQAKGRKIPYTTEPGAHVEDGHIVIDGQQIIAKDELALVGQHNVDNACAAVTAVWQITQDIPAMRQGLMGFKGLPHRLQLVAEVDGVKYYDDSIATTPGSAIAALRAFEQSKVIILGGSDKGADFAELAQEIATLGDGVKGIVLIGQMAEHILQALHAAGVSDMKIIKFAIRPTMAEIVDKARGRTQPGDVVIMSPACASFDVFRNYKDRGEQFIAAVRSLTIRDQSGD
jgi:UDP-N-acetylmuramoylalanine--D-glutamate ligase